MTQTISIHTDGSCEVKKGIGGYAAILRSGKHHREISGHVKDTTVNQMELRALIEGLSALKKVGQTVQVYTDSTYVAKGIAEWLPEWIGRGWKTSSNKPVKNVSLWQKLAELLKTHDVTATWIPREKNTEADRLAQAARKSEGSNETTVANPSIKTEKHLLIAGSREATGEMLNYALRVVRRAHEKGYTILVGDNPQGIDKTVVQECRRLNAKAIVFGISNFPRNGGVHHKQYIKVTSDLYEAMNGTRFAAYHARDRYMVDQAQTAIYIWNGYSKGTKMGADYMALRGKEVHLKEFAAPSYAEIIRKQVRPFVSSSKRN